MQVALTDKEIRTIRAQHLDGFNLWASIAVIVVFMLGAQAAALFHQNHTYTILEAAFGGGIGALVMRIIVSRKLRSLMDKLTVVDGSDSRPSSQRES